MSKKKKRTLEEMKQEDKTNIKVRLDARTVITVRDMAKLDFWKEKYPNLVVLTS